MKCALCSRTITNVYTLNSKSYGYNCYKLELEKLKLQRAAELQELKNEKINLRNLCIINIYSDKKFKDAYNQDFQTSVLDFYKANDFLSDKQFKVMFNKLTESEKLEFYFMHLELTNYKSAGDNKSIDNNYLFKAYDLIKSLEFNINDIRIANVYKYCRSITNDFYLVKYKEDNKTITRYTSDLAELKEDQEDGYISNLEYKLYPVN